MNKEGNTYTYLYASIVVVIVAGILTGISLGLQDRQKSNIEEEKMQKILKSVQVDVPRKKAKENYSKYIVDAYVINSSGEKIKGLDAFEVNLANEIKKSVDKRNLPVFVFKKEDDSKLIVPIYGKGMWGPLWGFVSFNEDFESIFGVTFDHKSETPGLGAEINTDEFQFQFRNKKIFDTKGMYRAIKVSKKKTDNHPHAVDAITGGTVTSVKLESSLEECLGAYALYLKKLKTHE